MKILKACMFLFFICGIVYADDIKPTRYIVVNLNNSIHTAAKKADDVLSNGQKRFPIYEELPDEFQNDFYYWGENGLTRKSDIEIKEIQDKEKEDVRKSNILSAYKKLKEIEAIELIDKGDWSKEKAKYQDIIDKEIKK